MSATTAPSCPMCRSADSVGPVDEPTGRWFCTACPLVFDGGGIEALAVAERQAQRKHPNATREVK